MENNIKLTNFTKSKEIRSFLERQFSKEFNMIVNGKSITVVKSMNLISLITNTFKNYPSFRSYFTGYTKEQLESIVNLMNTMDMNSPNPIRTKIASSLSTDELKDFIESKGGKTSGSVSKNTTYLINNDVESTSGKNKKAKELGVEIISEEGFLKMVWFLNLKVMFELKGKRRKQW